MNGLSSSPDHPQALAARLGHRFQDPRLLARALTHRSYRVEHPHDPAGDNETLEFLGDAVLDLVIGALLLNSSPQMSEGELTRLRSALVQERHLDLVARDLGLGDFLRLGRGEEQGGGRGKASILSSAYEAVIGAVFLDGGYAEAQAMVEAHFRGRIAEAQASLAGGDHKSALQELTQARFNSAPLYVLERAEGPDHAKTFTVSVRLQGRPVATAQASSKKAAEQKAAGLALASLRP